MKTKRISKKLENYSLLATAMLLTATAADGAVVYTDVSPDELLNDGTYFIDFDMDGSAEFRVGQYGFGTPGYFSYAETAFVSASSASAQVVATLSLGIWGYSYAVADALPGGATIGSSATSFTGGFALMGNVGNVKGYSLSSGQWKGLNDHYLGVRFLIGANTHYGWIRMDVAADASTATLKDFAYQDIPGMQIIAGEGLTNCPAPTGQVSTPNSPTNVTLSWDNMPDADKYQLQGRPVGASGFGSVISTVNMKTIPGLAPGASYEWKIRMLCLDGSISDFSGLQTFTMPTLKEGAQPVNEIVVYAFNGQLQVQSELPVSLLRLVDLQGRVVLEETGDFENKSIALGDLASGNYIVESTTFAGLSTKKIWLD